MIDLRRFSELLNANEDFSWGTLYFDGSFQLEFGEARYWLKVFMGKAILITEDIPPFGSTFTISGSKEAWLFALGEAKNRFREAIMTGKLSVEGNQIEFARVGRAMHGLSEVLRGMAREGSLSLICPGTSYSGSAKD